MDDIGIFDIIILLVIVYSILSPLLSKKKKKPQQPAQQQQQYESDTYGMGEDDEMILNYDDYPPSPVETVSYEKEVAMPDVKTEPVRHPSRMTKNKYSSDAYSSDAYSSDRIQSEMVERQKELMKKAEKLAGKREKEIITEIENIAYSRVFSKRAQELRSIVRKPVSLRSYVLVSEILREPKALRSDF